MAMGSFPIQSCTACVEEWYEDGISGFGYYVYGLVFPGSRSGRGIQSKNKVRVAAYRPVKYMTELYTKFIKNLK